MSTAPTSGPSWTHHDGIAPASDDRLMHFDEFRDLMDRTYGLQDSERGVAATVAWIAEEVGELAQAVRKGSREDQLHELGDVLAWVASLAAQLGLSMDEAVARYADGCPKCESRPCRCVSSYGE
jgi:NTP pyrophosphatase (non-canonical NTP hydrolase)